MSLIRQRLVSSMLALLLIVGLAPIAGAVLFSESAYAASKPTMTLTRVATGKLVMKKGSSYKIGAKATTGKVSYKSSAPKVATVSKKGAIKGKKAGKATITVTAKSGKAKTVKKIKVTVVKPSKFKKVKKISATMASTRLEVGASANLKVVFSPKKASNKNLLFASSNAAVATVTAAGKVSARKAGKATITVTSCDNKKAKQKIVVSVYRKLQMDDLAGLVEQGKVDATANDGGYVDSVYGEFTSEKVTTKAEAAQVLNASADLIGEGLRASASDIDVRAPALSGVDLRLFRYSPKVNGIPVEGSQVILGATRAGKVEALTSSYDGAVNKTNTKASITASTATSNAKGFALAEGASGVLSTSVKLVVLSAAYSPRPALVYRVDVAPVGEDSGTWPGSTYYIYANDAVGTAGTCALATSWDVDLEVPEGVPQESALTVGALEPAAESWTSATVSATDKLGSSRQISVQQNGSGTYRTKDAIRNVETRKVTFRTTSTGVSEAIYPGNLIEFASGGLDAEAASLHANMEAAYDYYRNKLGRNSFDASGAAVQASYGETSWHNACWNPGAQQFKFGGGKDYAAALDVVGHEFTHAVVNYVVGDGHGRTLTYQGESGALNESYADIMGTFIEQKSRADSGYWLHGEDTGSASRSLSNPASISCSPSWQERYGMSGYPSTYSERYTGSEDRGGVHLNSGIFNHAAYYMVVDDRTSSIGDDTWAQVFYSSLFLLASDSNFEQGRNAVVVAAALHGFSSEQIQAVKEAFWKVGIGSPVNTEESLRTALEAATSDPILKFYFADFDRDFDYEAFAVTGTGDEYWVDPASIWYIDEDGATLLQSGTHGYVNGLVSSKHFKFLSFEQSAGGSGSTSLVFGSRSGSPCKMGFSGTASWTGSTRTYTWNSSNVMSFSDAAGDYATSTVSGCFVNGYHQYPQLTFTFDPVLFRFKLVKYERV